MTLLLVTAAGAAGVAARYGISSAFPGGSLPWVTVAINVAGSFLLGVLVTAGWFSPETRTVLGFGLLGGFTTFSTFSVQAILDIEAGRPGRALGYVGASVGLGLLAAALGFVLGRALMQR